MNELLLSSCRPHTVVVGGSAIGIVDTVDVDTTIGDGSFVIKSSTVLLLLGSLSRLRLSDK